MADLDISKNLKGRKKISIGLRLRPEKVSPNLHSSSYSSQNKNENTNKQDENKATENTLQSSLSASLANMVSEVKKTTGPKPTVENNQDYNKETEKINSNDQSNTNKQNSENTELHQYWRYVRENPYDFGGWTSLLSHAESLVSIINLFLFVIYYINKY